MGLIGCQTYKVPLSGLPQQRGRLADLDRDGRQTPAQEIRRYLEVDDGCTPQYTLITRSWHLSPKTADTNFTFVPPADAKQIDFITISGAEATGNNYRRKNYGNSHQNIDSR